MNDKFDSDKNRKTQQFKKIPREKIIQEMWIEMIMKAEVFPNWKTKEMNC